MTWAKTITLIVAVALLAGGAVWAYRLFEAPEPVEAVTAKWESSGHADATSESFTHWNEDDPAEMGVACAKCHSTYGYHDYLGADGSAFGVVDAPAPAGGMLFCTTCHNSASYALTSAIFPGGAEITGLGWESNCMRCHQGRQSTASVNAAIAGIADDAVTDGLGFINVHYAVGAGTLMGGDVAVGYQYAGKSYVGRYPHVKDYDTCIECHDPHSAAIEPDTCAPCHANVVTYGDLFDIRANKVDYDGDGDTDEGILGEIRTLHDALLAAIRAYGTDVVGAPIAYVPAQPYWSNADGARYTSWTPRLVRATYIYHYVAEDPGGFTHNARYVVQMLYDALEDLSVAVPVDLSAYTRP
ncbi:MAG: polyheme membrane-associated cytochrome C [Anaerolineae bacterium]|jgi:hypothetical protein|nr:polyheme membrane-associated cytochrome C [Anaerolineae bacterium]